MTLVDATNTPDQPTPPETRDSEAVPAKALAELPFKARLSLFRQRVILTVRWWFRLPIDELKEHNIEARFDRLLELAKKQHETIGTLTRISNQMQARLQWYETHIPRMRELKREFEREQEALRMLAGQESKEAGERLQHGILEIVT